MFNFKNTYIKNPDRFYSRVTAAEVQNPKLLAFNYDLAKELTGEDFTKYSQQQLASFFSGQTKGIDSIAQAYCGHQFGNLNPSLGDGRAMLLGEVVSPIGQRFDIQLKGSGPTPYSRNGDGLSALGPVLREYIVSEAMHTLGVPSTRALAAVATNETVYRQQQEPAGIFTRVAKSHVRVGTFEYFAIREDYEGLKQLIDYTIERHYPMAKEDYLLFIESVAKNWAIMVSKWMSLGFIHGVMNTDNMSVSGQTIDFGPCAFMDTYKADKTFSSIDRHGRYAYNNQLKISKWNLYRFASCFTPFIEASAIESKLKQIDSIFEDNWLEQMSNKFGLSPSNKKSRNIIEQFLNILEENKLDYTISFTKLTHDKDSFLTAPIFSNFKSLWEEQEINDELMIATNPRFIPRNHQIEKAIQKAYAGDYSHFTNLVEAYKKPFIKNDELEKEPLKSEIVSATFCGT